MDDLIDGRCASLRMIQLNQGAGIEEMAGQRSTFLSVGNNFSSHGSINLRRRLPSTCSFSFKSNGCSGRSTPFS
jgi:hypothetical protein